MTKLKTCFYDVSNLEEIIMTDYTHQTAPTQFVDGAGIRFAYRRFGKNQGVPLVFFQHFTGTMDNWDPTVTNGLARDREVILFNNAGISGSGGETPTQSLRWHGMRYNFYKWRSDPYIAC